MTSIRDLVRGFLLTKTTEGKSPHTIRYYEQIFRGFLWYIEQHKLPEYAKHLDEWNIRAFLGYVASDTDRWGLCGNQAGSSRRQASQSTLHHYYRAIKHFFNWAIEEGYLEKNPAAKIKVSRPKPRVVKPPTESQIQALLKVCELDFQRSRFLGSRNKAIILVLFDTGVRASELCNMKLTDLNEENGQVRILGKGDKERVVRLGTNAQKALWKYLVFRSQNGRKEVWLTEEGLPLRTRGLQAMIRDYKHRADLDGIKLSAHTFRHGFALAFLREDRNPFNLQYLLGHNDLSMVRRYVSTMGMEDALQAHIKASPADHLKVR